MNSLNPSVMDKVGAFIVVLALVVSGCAETSSNPDARDLSAYEPNTELFLGYELGMTKDEFYERSWQLNKKQMVKQGPKNQTVQYEIDELSHPAKMYFYPDFHDGRVFQMKVKFEYTGWAPWNDHLASDSLQSDVIRLLKEWYGPGFTRVADKNNPNSRVRYVKTDKNRRIIVAKHTDRAVVAMFTDIVVEEEVNSEEE